MCTLNQLLWDHRVTYREGWQMSPTRVRVLRRRAASSSISVTLVYLSPGCSSLVFQHHWPDHRLL